MPYFFVDVVGLSRSENLVSSMKPRKGSVDLLHKPTANRPLAHGPTMKAYLLFQSLGIAHGLADISPISWLKRSRSCADTRSHCRQVHLDRARRHHRRRTRSVRSHHPDRHRRRRRLARILPIALGRFRRNDTGHRGTRRTDSRVAVVQSSVVVASVLLHQQLAVGVHGHGHAQRFVEAQCIRRVADGARQGGLFSQVVLEFAERPRDLLEFSRRHQSGHQPRRRSSRRRISATLSLSSVKSCRSPATVSLRLAKSCLSPLMSARIARTSSPMPLARLAISRLSSRRASARSAFVAGLVTVAAPPTPEYGPRSDRSARRAPTRGFAVPRPAPRRQSCRRPVA